MDGKLSFFSIIYQWKIQKSLERVKIEDHQFILLHYQLKITKEILPSQKNNIAWNFKHKQSRMIIAEKEKGIEKLSIYDFPKLPLNNTKS